jgi:hypothetical protein
LDLGLIGLWEQAPPNFPVFVGLEKFSLIKSLRTSAKRFELIGTEGRLRLSGGHRLGIAEKRMKDESLSTPREDAPGCRIGFGMLRIDTDHPEHREALVSALVRGVELFDLGEFEGETSTFGAKADLLLGLARDMRVPELTLLVRGALGSADRFTPRESTRNLTLNWVYLISDPEFALPDYGWDHARLYKKLAAELDLLENRAIEGGLAGYGVGSAAFTYAKEDPEALALEPLLVDDDGKRSERRRHFKWVEFPLNLFESEAATEINQVYGNEAGTLITVAKKWDLTTVARRPLDAMTEAGLLRLVAYPDHHRLDLNLAVSRTLEAVLKTEGEFLAKPNHAKTLAGEDASTLSPLWANRLRDQLKHVTDPEQWKEILRRKIEPDLKALKAEYSGENASEVSRAYFDGMDALLLAVRLWCEKNAAERNERIRARIVEAVPYLQEKRRLEDRNLAVLALRIYRSIPGLDFILVGMRIPKYVQALASKPVGLALDDILPPDALDAALITGHTTLREQSL